MGAGRTLRIEGVVSGQLHAVPASVASDLPRMERYSSIISVESSGLDHSVVRLRERQPREPVLFFGIDSLYSLLKNHRDRSLAMKRRSTIFCLCGFDIAVDDPKVDGLFSMSVRNARRVADQFGKTLLVASTNLRHFTNRFVSWGKTCHARQWPVSRPGALGDGFRRSRLLPPLIGKDSIPGVRILSSILCGPMGRWS